ncbi:unnamed protein product [Ectocarpus sp. 12 AP-2014]
MSPKLCHLTPPTSTRYTERMVSVSRPLLAFAAARAQGTVVSTVE